MKNSSRVLTVFSKLRDRFRRWMLWDDQQLPLGKRGERLAAKFIRKQGMRVVAESEATRLGEIDLIAIDRGTVVFVEVKTRRHHQSGNPLEAVDERKQRQLTQLALQFMKRHRLLESRARFDVVGITWPEDESRPEIVHVRDAFPPVGKWQMFG